MLSTLSVDAATEGWGGVLAILGRGPLGEGAVLAAGNENGNRGEPAAIKKIDIAEKKL